MPRVPGSGGATADDEDGGAAATLFAGPGEMRARSRALDWATTPLGPVDSWPAALRTGVRLMLESPLPTSLWVGAEYTLLYNDAYAGLLGSNHPGALGRPGSGAWTEVWPAFLPKFEAIRTGGPPDYGEAALVPAVRRAGGPVEHAWFTYSISALTDDDGRCLAVWNNAIEVTGRVIAERALEAERERLRTLILQMPTPVALHEGPEHRHVLVNDAYKRVSGGGRDVTGLTVRETFPELVPSGIFDVFDRVYATGEAWSSPEILAPYDRDGTGVIDTWWNLRYEPVRDATGAVTGVLTLAVDITEQVRARHEVERLLGESEARLFAERRFRAVQEAAPYGFGLHVPVRDREGRVVDFRIPYVNAAGARLVGRTVTEIQGSTQRTLWPATAESIFGDFLRTLETGEPTRRELAARLDGIAAGLAVTAVRIGTGDDAELAVTFEDITARLRGETERARLLADAEAARAAAEANERRLADVIEHLPVGLTFAEAPEGRHSVSNPAAVAIWGRMPQSPAVAAYSRDFVGFRPGPGAPGSPEEEARRYASEDWPLARALLTGEVVEDELAEIVRPDGTRRMVSLNSAPMRDAEGRVTGALVTTVDVTERERLLADAQAARAEAEAASRAKSEFLAVMSHELRTPLNAIGGYTELIELGVYGPLTIEQQGALARIQTSQRHLLGLIAGVLDYSRVEAGAVAYQITEVPVTEAVAEAETLVAPQLRARGLSYAWSAAAPGLCVHADREKLQQILLNLLGNSIKFTDVRDGMPGRIEVSCSAGEAVGADGRTRAVVQLRVHDTGVGIPAEQLERVFEPFVQADQRLTRPQQGIGLGLAISRDLARGMGGELTVESTPGVGSTFTLTLPRA